MDAAVIIPQCADGIDNDDDGRSTSMTPDVSMKRIETKAMNSHSLECSDGDDNDDDGRTDGDDPGCEDDSDDDESDDPPQCSDTIDNDDDGAYDHPADPGCVSPTDVDERR